jgi:DNA-binding FadR family transcriptional regulator
VREGIRLLEQSGFVKRASGRRLHVTLPHYADLAPRQARALVMQRVSFRELWEVSVELEPLAARLAAGRISAAQLEALEANLAATAAAVLAGRSVVELDIAFHQLIAEAAGNRVLLLAREPISSLFYPAITAMFERPPIREVGPRRLVAAHRAILDALATGDGATAARWMAKHIVDFKRGYDVCGLDLDATVERMPARRGVAAT